MAFQVGVTSDLFDQRGEPTFGREPLKALDAVDWEKLPPGLRDHAGTCRRIRCPM